MNKQKIYYNKLLLALSVILMALTIIEVVGNFFIKTNEVNYYELAQKEINTEDGLNVEVFKVNGVYDKVAIKNFKKEHAGKDYTDADLALFDKINPGRINFDGDTVEKICSNNDFKWRTLVFYGRHEDIFSIRYAGEMALTSDGGYYNYRPLVNSMTQYDNYYDTKIIGKVPNENNEAMISDYVADCIIKYGVEGKYNLQSQNNIAYFPENYEQIIRDGFYLDIGEGVYIKITGIVDNNCSMYADLKENSQYNCDPDRLAAFHTKLDFIPAIYVSPSFVETIKSTDGYFESFKAVYTNIRSLDELTKLEKIYPNDKGTLISQNVASIVADMYSMNIEGYNVKDVIQCIVLLTITIFTLLCFFKIMVNKNKVATTEEKRKLKSKMVKLLICIIVISMIVAYAILTVLINYNGAGILSQAQSYLSYEFNTKIYSINLLPALGVVLGIGLICTVMLNFVWIK